MSDEEISAGSAVATEQMSDERLDYFTKRMRMATAHEHTFTKSEVGEAVVFVKETFCIDPSDRQFEAVLASLCRMLSDNATRYGKFGDDDEAYADDRGRSSFKYWLDQFLNGEIEKLTSCVERTAKMPPELEFKIVTKTDKKCESCKAKPETGDVNAVVFGDWRPVARICGGNGPIVGFRKDRHYCLAANCVANLSPALKEGRVFHGSVPPEARAAVETALAAPAGTPKPTDRFKKLRKRARDDGDDDEESFEFSEEAKAKIASLIAANEEKKAAPKRQVDAARMRKYRPTIEEFMDVTAPAEDGICVYTFSERDGRRRCPYDVTQGSPFCSMCKIMVGLYKAGGSVAVY